MQLIDSWLDSDAVVVAWVALLLALLALVLLPVVQRAKVKRERRKNAKERALHRAPSFDNDARARETELPPI